MREITEEWISKAEDDYRSVEALLYVVEIPIVDTVFSLPAVCGKICKGLSRRT